MTVPFFDLTRQYSQIRDEINRAIQEVLDRQFFILGEELEKFEKQWALYLGIKYVCGIASGTDGLILALKSVGIKAGDEVITTPLSFISSTSAITEVGAKPVFVDVDPQTYQIDADRIEEKINKRTKAILPVHLYGAPCDIKKIIEIAKKHKLKVIEDACQAHGAKLDGQNTGTFGDVSVFSFYPSKNLGGYGDGGVVCTDNKDIYQNLLYLRNYGQERKYYHKILGQNSRLDEIQAAVLRVKLKYLDNWNAERKRIARLYIDNLFTYKVQKILEKAESCYHLFVIETDDRQDLISFLQKKGIHCLIHYPVPIHLQECYQYLGFKGGDFPQAEKVCQRILSLPMFTELREEEVYYIINTLNKYKK